MSVDYIIMMNTNESTIVVIPSLSFHPNELRDVKGVSRFEERLLYVILGQSTDLRKRKAIDLGKEYTKVIYITSTPLDPSIIDYFLSLSNGDRNQFISLTIDDDEFIPLSQKLLSHPRFLERLKTMSGDGELRGTELESELVNKLHMPSSSATPEQLFWGTKSGSRILFKECDVAHPDGTYEPIFDANELSKQIVNVYLRNRVCKKGIVKLLDGYAGRGNAVFDLQYFQDYTIPLEKVDEGLHAELVQKTKEQLQSSLDYVYKQHTFESFEKEMQEMGVIFELFVDLGGKVTSPSVQAFVNEKGVQILSSHEQTLDGQCYIGCNFPALPDYSQRIINATKRVGEALRTRGIHDHFSVDFLCTTQDSGWEISAIEINLRLTGTTHPFMAVHYMCDGVFTSDGEYVCDKGPRFYVSSDHVEHAEFKKLVPMDILEFSKVYNECKWNADTKTGVLFHLLGCLCFGSIGLTAVGRTAEECRILFDQAVKKLIEMA